MGKKSNSPTKSSTAKKAKSTLSKGKSGGRGAGTASDRILNAIAGRTALKEERPCRRVVMGLAAMANEKSFSTTILNMRNKGLVQYDRTSIWLTDKGKEHVGEDALAVPQSNDAMQERLREEQVKGKVPRMIFDILLDGKAYYRSDLAKLLNKEDNKSFGTYVSALSKVTERVDKRIRLKDVAFPCGRPSE